MSRIVPQKKITKGELVYRALTGMNGKARFAMDARALNLAYGDAPSPGAAERNAKKPVRLAGEALLFIRDCMSLPDQRKSTLDGLDIPNAH